jgi:hypothetical protein
MRVRVRVRVRAHVVCAIWEPYKTRPASKPSLRLFHASTANTKASKLANTNIGTQLLSSYDSAKTCHIYLEINKCKDARWSSLEVSGTRYELLPLSP